MVRPDVLERFAKTFGPAGFDAKAFVPSYGMAEVCLAITFSPHGRGVRTDTIDRAMDLLEVVADEMPGPVGPEKSPVATT